MAQSVCHREKTIHANLPPQTGVQLGQSGGESSGVERAQRSLDQGPDCSRVIYSSRTMMAAGVSTDGEALTAPAQTAQTHLTDVHTCMSTRGRPARVHTHTHTHTQPPKHTLCWITKVLGSTLPGLLCDLDVPPRLAFDPLCFTNNTLTKTTQQATSYELSTDKTGSYRSPRSGVCKSDGKS